MIYTDGVHLVTTGTIEDLHAFAAGIGLKREWFQDHKHPHYDILSRKIRASAIRNGARLVEKKVLIRLLKVGEQNG